MAAPPNDTNRITVTVNSTEYTVDTIKMPYFASNPSTNPTLPHFATALLCVEDGLHSAFDALKTDITAYPILCQTLQRLAVDVLGPRSLTQITTDCKTFRFYDDESKIASTNLATDSVFRLLYMHHTGGLRPQDRGKVFEAVSYILSHRYFFGHLARGVLRETYRTSMGASGKQLVAIDKWPVYGKDGVPVEPYADEDDSDDDYCYGSDSEGESHFRYY
ncbi:hypothetical protein Q9L58_001893 [Maublancomyces gigas]|uniref:Uncharacterized protein n=1 Tax=Discina gigas TaxID=1032678 RepID=A0ABR3GTG9_9PEZI